MGRRNDHSREEIRQMALDAGTELLQQHGVAAVSARKVASRINYTVGTLYLVFENLEIVEFVKRETKSKSCACETRNPSGRCCLSDFKTITQLF